MYVKAQIMCQVLTAVCVPTGEVHTFISLGDNWYPDEKCGEIKYSELSPKQDMKFNWDKPLSSIQFEGIFSYSLLHLQDRK